ncbi:shTK domain protein [Dictyocaulus viviparus]|uniref:ShTK domain protein n=1 Tax=Dictyocaulus viviparus TaxID=29172 RepID=A0A0D8XBY1_DICVI|nr:shTK domain protein [Dictyocaulus viviparus]
MLNIWVLLATIHCTTSPTTIAAATTGVSGIIDPRCTVPSKGALKFSHEAVNCDNELSDDECRMFYSIEVKENDDKDRDKKCYEKVTDAYIACSAVTREMCKDPMWKPILVENCPKTCGFCRETNAVTIGFEIIFAIIHYILLLRKNSFVANSAICAANIRQRLRYDIPSPSITVYQQYRKR